MNQIIWERPEQRMVIREPYKIQYIRTSSKSSFKKDSPERQQKYSEKKIKGKFDLTIKERISSIVSLEKRTGWNELQEFCDQKYGNVTVFAESLSRFGRSEREQDTQKGYKESLRIQRIVALDALDQFNPKYDWISKKTIQSQKKEIEKEQQIAALQEKRAYVRAQKIEPGKKLTSSGKPRFDGRKLTSNKAPYIKEKIWNKKSRKVRWVEIRKEVNEYLLIHNKGKGISIRSMQRIYARMKEEKKHGGSTQGE